MAAKLVLEAWGRVHQINMLANFILRMRMSRSLRLCGVHQTIANADFTVYAFANGTSI